MKIPITFEHEGKHYKGTLEPVQGAGASQQWHLMIDNFYFGCLRINKAGWIFDTTPKNESMAGLADFFGEYIVLWHG